MKIEKQQIDDFTIIRPESSHIDASNVAEINNFIVDVIARGQEKIILDLSKVEFVDSAGVGTLISIYKMLDSKENFIMCGITKKARKIFDCTRLTDLIKDFPTVQDALARKV